MTYRTRLKYTDEMKSYIWDRYKQGDAGQAKTVVLNPWAEKQCHIEQDAWGFE